jgi:hypothetical protein
MIKMSLDMQVKEFIGKVTMREERDGGYDRGVGWGMGGWGHWIHCDCSTQWPGYFSFITPRALSR